MLPHVHNLWQQWALSPLTLAVILCRYLGDIRKAHPNVSTSVESRHGGRCHPVSRIRSRAERWGQGQKATRKVKVSDFLYFSELIGKRTRQKERFWIVRNGPFGTSTGQWWESPAWLSDTWMLCCFGFNCFHSPTERKRPSLTTRCLMLTKTVTYCKIGFGIHSYHLGAFSQICQFNLWQKKKLSTHKHRIREEESCGNSAWGPLDPRILHLPSNNFLLITLNS